MKARRPPIAKPGTVGSASDHALVAWNPEFGQAILYAVKGGGGNTYDVPGGVPRPRMRSPSKKHVAVYTCVLQSLGEVDDWSEGVMRCKRFKRWLSPAAYKQLLAKTGCEPGEECT